MRVLILFLFVGLFAATPVYLLDNLVMPELMALKESYSSYDVKAEQITNAK